MKEKEGFLIYFSFSTCHRFPEGGFISSWTSLWSVATHDPLHNPNNDWVATPPWFQAGPCCPASLFCLCLGWALINHRSPHSRAKHNYILVIVQSLSHVWLFETPWTVACQALLSMGFLRQEYWAGLPFPSPGHLPNPETAWKPASPILAGRLFTSEPSEKPNCIFITVHNWY